MSKKLVEFEKKDWLRLYVDSVLLSYQNKYNVEVDKESVDKACKLVSNLNLPEAVDVYYAILLVIKPRDYDLEYIQADIDVWKDNNMKLGLDILLFSYSKECEFYRYDDKLAFVFKSCIQYCIPF